MFYLIPITITFVCTDLMRHYFQPLNNIYLKFFSKVTRKIEKDNFTLTGASYYLLGCSLIFLFFDNKYIIVSSLLTMTISDSFAAIVGIKYGETKIFRESSLEGSFAFLISTIIIMFLFAPTLSLFEILFISICATFVELFSTHYINDNITIPLSCGILIHIFI